MEQKQKFNMGMLVVAGVILVAVNAGVWVATQSGAIPPVSHTPLWAAFVVLNIASILWAVTMLGLQPLVAAVSYAAGGAIAYFGVRSVAGVNIAEIVTAGAIYGAFGALAISNAMIKVRLAFFHKAQVPFVFIILALLVLDAVLNSRISHADSKAYLNALVFPFVFGGAAVGLVWSVIARVTGGSKPKAAVKSASKAKAVAEKPKAKEKEARKIKLDVPEKTTAKPVETPAPKPEPVQPAPAPIPAPAAPQPEPIVAREEPAPVVEQEPSEPIIAEEEKPVVAKAPEDDAFFPLEIDKDEDFGGMDTPTDEVAQEDDFVLPTFDSNLYSAGTADSEPFGGVAVEEPQKSISVEADEQDETQKPLSSEADGQEDEQQAVQEPEKDEDKKPEEKNDDWLGGHMDLLNKLK